MSARGGGLWRLVSGFAGHMVGAASMSQCQEVLQSTSAMLAGRHADRMDVKTVLETQSTEHMQLQPAVFWLRAKP